MDRTESLELVMKGLLCDEIVIEALKEKFGEKTEEVISEIKGNGTLEFDGEYLLDLFYDLLMTDARTYVTYLGEGSCGEFPISVMGLGSVFYYSAPEFDDIGYFRDVDDAIASAESDFFEYIDFDKTIDYGIDPPIFEDMDDMDNYKKTSSICEETPVDPFVSEIEKIFERRGGTGSYSSKNELTGELYRFTQATGMGRDFARRSYEKTFGEGPEWVVKLHPGVQHSLYKLAEKHKKPLPDSPPTVS